VVVGSFVPDAFVFRRRKDCAAARSVALHVLRAPSMVYRFEDLDVWRDAKEQCDRIGELLKRPMFRDDPELSRQLNSAGISVTNNISEGFMRNHDKEFLQFLRISAGSNAEVRSCFYAVPKGPAPTPRRRT
jgi:four helix bundle protein